MHAVFFRSAAELFQMAIKPFDFCKETDIIPKLIQNPDRIFWIGRNDQIVPRIPDRLQVSGSNVPTHANNCKVF